MGSVELLRSADRLCHKVFQDGAGCEAYLFNRVLDDDDIREIRYDNTYYSGPGGGYGKVVAWRTKRRTLVTLKYGYDI